MTRPAVLRSPSRRAGLLAACAASALGSAVLWGGDACALPTGSTVQTGTATVTTAGSGKEVDVNQSSQRAFIDWSSFNLSADEIVAFKQALGASSITFNRVTGESLTTIQGSITAPGAVWLFTPSGLIIGPTAKINVGAFVASTGNVEPNFCGSDCGPSGPGAFLPLTDHSVPIFGATAPITVQSGATINAGNGFVVLNSEQVTQNGQITASDAVGYVLADAPTISFTDTNASGSVQRLGAIDVSGSEQADASLNHGGSTTGAWVQVAAPDEAAGGDSPFAGVINMSGVTQATGVAPAGTDQASVLLVGVDTTVATPITGGNRSFAIDASGGSIGAANGGLFFTGSSARLGAVNVKGNLDGAVDGDLALTGTTAAADVYLAGDTITVGAPGVFSGDVDLESGSDLTIAANAGVSAAGAVTVNAGGAVTLGAGSVLRADSGGAGSASLSLGAGSVSADASSAIVAGPASGAPTSDLTIVAGQTVTLGTTGGATVYLEADGGDLTLLGPSTASVLFHAWAPSGAVVVSADVTSQGAIEIDGGNAIQADAGVTLRSNAGGGPKGGIDLTTYDLELDPTSALIAGPVTGAPVGDVLLSGFNTANIGKVTGHDVTVDSYGDVTLGGDVLATGNVSVSQYSNGDYYDIPDSITVGAGVKVAAGGFVDVESVSLITLQDKAVLQSNTASGGGDIWLESFAVDAAPTSLLSAGPVTGPGTDAVTVYADGGDLKAGNIVGTDVHLEADAGASQCPDCGFGEFGPVLGAGSGGSVYLEGTIKAAGRFDAISDFADVHADGAVTAAGVVNVNAAGDILGGPGMAIIGDTSGAGSALTLTASGAISLDAASSLQNGATAAHPTGKVALTALGGAIDTGAIAGTDVTLSTADAVTVGGALYGSTSVSIDPTDVTLNANVASGGALDIAADNAITLGAGVTVSAGDHLNLTATTIATGKGAVLQSDSDGDGAGDMTLTAQSVSGGVSLIAGKDATHPSAAITADASAGGLDLGGVTGDVVALTGEAGDVTLAGPSATGAALTVKAVGGTITLGGGVTGGGTIDLTADKAIIVAPGAVVGAAGHLNATAASISIGAGGGFASDTDNSGGGDLTLAASGDVTAAPGSALAGHGGNVSVTSSTGALTLGAVSGNGITLSSAKDLALGGNINAAGALSATSTAGQVQVQSSLASGGDMTLDAHAALGFATGVTVSAGGHLDGEATTITLGAGATVASDAQHKGGARTLTLHAATGDITAGAGALVDGGAAAASVTSDQGAVTLASASGGSLTISAAKAATLNGAMTATGAIAVNAQSIAANAGITGGDIDLQAGQGIAVASGQTFKAGRDLTLGAGAAITLAANDQLQGDAAGTGAGGVFLSADSIVADPTSLLLAGASPASPSGQVNVQASGDVNLGQATADQVFVFGGGDVTLAGAVQGAHGVFVDPGDLTILANMSSGGQIYLATGSGGVLTVGSGVSVTSTGDQVALISDGDLTIGANASVTGVSLLAQTQGVLHLASGATLNTTGQATAPTWPIVPTTVVNQGEGGLVVRGLNIAAAGLDLQGSIVAGKAGARDDVYITALGAPQSVVVGGADASGGFHLSNAAIGRITARNLVVMAGQGEGGANADILVQDLTLNSAQLGALALGTDSGHSIDVTGAVALQGGGQVDLHLGFARAASTTVIGGGNTDAPPTQQPQTLLTGYVPGEIDVSGSLGTAAAPFQTAVLLARDDIFMGSADFIAAAKADAKFDAGKASGAYAIDTGHVFLASHDLELGAEGRIIQQNTGGQLRYAGLVFDTPTSGHELIANPTSLDGQDLGAGNDGGGWTPNYAAGPTRVDVFGLVTRPNGTTTNSVDAAMEAGLSAPAIADVSQYRINTCVFATRCLTAPPPRIEVPTDEVVQAQAAADSSSASASQTPTGFAQSIQIDDTSDDEKSANGAPVTGSGNGDLWTGPPSTPH
ncbi:filamentous hemagglutinin N-terminal domain-containing protein [Caulobacter sp. KR2-114]|uniref:two-partner secretion domain-containing protein n=1 Tax=Caulobacter sp. KR2-114 TaxID=3400912 RepID=UPI003C0527E1